MTNQVLPEVTHSKPQLCHLHQLGLIELSGTDARVFLQGQLTNDVQLLDGHRAHLSAYCTVQGRMLALLLAFAYQDKLYLRLPKSLLAAVQKRLSLYVLRAKVTLTCSDMVHYGLSGANAESLINAVFGGMAPRSDWDLVALEHLMLLRLPSHAGPRYLLMTAATHAASLWQTLAQHSVVVEEAFWESMEVAAGLPEIYPETQGLFVPQALNLEVLNAISFKKGCYVGQEIVARTHYLGKIKRHLRAGQLATLCSVGDVVRDMQGVEQGHVVRIAPHPEGGYALLLTVLISAPATLMINAHPLSLSA